MTGSQSGRLRSEVQKNATAAPATGMRMPANANCMNQSLKVESRSVLIDVNARLM